MVQQFDQEFGPQLAKGNEAFAAELRKIKAHGIPLRSLHFATTSDRLSLDATVSASGNLPPLQPAPKLPASYDLAARVHQSVLTQSALAVFSGRTYTLDESGSFTSAATQTTLSRWSHASLADVPRGLGAKQVSVTFADQPLAVAFADQGCTLTIRIQELRARRFAVAGPDAAATNYR